MGMRTASPEDVATRTGIILRAGAAGAGAGASGRCRRLICRLICRLDNFPTDRGTRFRGKLSLRQRIQGILGVGGSSGALVTTTGGRVRIWARGLREELWREPSRRRWREVQLRPSSRRRGFFSTAAGDHRGKFKLWSFRDWVRSLPAAAIRRRIRYPCGFGDSPAAAAAPTPARRHASCHVYLGNSLFSGYRRSSSERRSPAALHRT